LHSFLSSWPHFLLLPTVVTALLKSCDGEILIGGRDLNKGMTSAAKLGSRGSEDGEAETEICRAAKPSWRTTTRTSGPQGLNLTEPPGADPACRVTPPYADFEKSSPGSEHPKTQVPKGGTREPGLRARQVASKGGTLSKHHAPEIEFARTAKRRQQINANLEQPLLI
jgi:hypothetical protein